MLHASFVRAHTHTKATYDVHDVFSVHVCYKDILFYDECTFSPLFSNFSSSIVALPLMEFFWSTTYIGTWLLE